MEAQFAPVEAIQVLDANQDSHPDLVLAGNRTYARVKLGNLGGNHGQLLLSDGKGNYTFAAYSRSGLQLRGDVQALKTIRSNGKQALLFGQNNGPASLWMLRK
jgi:hypothetical protein